MKIYSITNTIFLNYPNKSTKNNRKISKYSEFDKYVKSSDISFGSNKIKNNGLFDEFNCKYKEIYGNRPVEVVISENIENLPLLNLGKDKKVYRFPKLEEYIIAHWYKLPPDKKLSPMVECEIDFPKYNFGQCFVSNGIFDIRKYIPGVSCSVDDYHKVISYICKNGDATPQMAGEYLSKLRLFKDFPQTAYDDLAQQTRYLIDEVKFIDCANPNNLLIDTNAKKFHIIDLLSKEDLAFCQEYSKKANGAISGVYDMLNLLLDLKFQCYYLDKMTPEQIQETTLQSEEVIKKVFKAAQKEKISFSDKLNTVIFDWCGKYKYGDNFAKRYAECKSLYRLL